jgi:putative ABC transport system permease protein
MALLAVFGATALTLAAIGVFGVLSVSVNQRVRDIGIRMALGSPRRRVLSRVLSQGMVPVLAGVVVGLGAASGLTRFLSHQVYGVSTTDPTVFAVVSLFLVLVAFLACILPARRATQIDLTTVLRSE